MHEVSFAYLKKKRRIPVFDGFSFEVGQGERVALLGESGSGKSTVLALAAGLEVPDQGKVMLAGQDTSALSPSQRAGLRLSHVGQIFQDFRLFPELTAAENVAFMARLGGTPGAEAQERAAQALRDVGLNNRTDHKPDELSGGERQRVAIARVLVASPSLVLADEPTGSLDADRRDEILQLALRVLPQAAFVLVTHDPEVAKYASRVVTMPTLS